MAVQNIPFDMQGNILMGGKNFNVFELLQSNNVVYTMDNLQEAEKQANEKEVVRMALKVDTTEEQIDEKEEEGTANHHVLNAHQVLRLLNLHSEKRVSVLVCLGVTFDILCFLACW